MKKFLKAALRFIMKFPVHVAGVILIPSLVTSIVYLFSIEELYYNLYYYGERIHTDPENFQLKSIKKVANVVQVSSTFSYQGGACYENYYAVVTDNFEALLIYNTENKFKVEHNISTGIVNTDWHCNQMFFGTDFYSASDKFPLLYISMESPKVHSLFAFRIYQLSGVYYVKQIQQITLDFYDDKTVYYPNAYYDYDTNLVYYVGYTKNSYLKEEDNKLRYYTFYLPDYRIDQLSFFTDESEEEPFELPSETAGQGGFISKGYLYQTFSFASKDDPIRAPKMRIVDLRNHKIVYDNQNLGAAFGVYEEFEHLAISESGHMFSLGNPYNIYEFEYEHTDDWDDDFIEYDEDEDEGEGESEND